jgi:hypothetical protein
MAAPAAQNFANHRRYDPPWHFAGALIVAAGVVVAIVHAIRHPEGFWNWWFAVYALGIALCIFRARSHVTTVQNRVIRLEMRQRLKEVLAPALAARIGELSVSQLVGLRFASDAELPALVDRCLKGELTRADAIKKEIKNWQADWLRA